MINDAEHLFRYPMAICMSSHFLVRLFMFLAIELYKFFIYLGIFSGQICKYSLSLSTLPYFVDGLLCCAEVF